MGICCFSLVHTSIAVLNFVDDKFIAAAGCVISVDRNSAVFSHSSTVFEDLDVRDGIATAVDHKRGGRVFDKFRVSELDNKYWVGGFFTLLFLSSRETVNFQICRACGSFPARCCDSACVLSTVSGGAAQQFQREQAVLGGDLNSVSKFVIKRFVIFQPCGGDSCSSAGTCFKHCLLTGCGELPLHLLFECETSHSVHRMFHSFPN